MLLATIVAVAATVAAPLCAEALADDCGGVLHDVPLSSALVGSLLSACIGAFALPIIGLIGEQGSSGRPGGLRPCLVVAPAHAPIRI